MKSSDSEIFDVYSYSKIPYLTRFLEILSIILVVFITLALLPLEFLNNSPHEVRSFIIRWLYPDILRHIVVVCVVIAAIILPLYFGVKRKRVAKLILKMDKIEIEGKNYKKIFPINSIKDLYIFDPQNQDGLPMEKFTIALYSAEGKPTRVQLKKYSDAEMIMNRLIKYEYLRIKAFSENYLPVVDEE
ncbi:MAG: hypothetical protein IT234_00010 [Bacteroidia bacterium]|nr:hypothetical protein [Bacteroidia bacterium]